MLGEELPSRFDAGDPVAVPDEAEACCWFDPCTQALGVRPERPDQGDRVERTVTGGPEPAE